MGAGRCPIPEAGSLSNQGLRFRSHRDPVDRIEAQDRVRAACHLRPVRNADTRDAEAPEPFVDLALVLHVEMRSSLVQEQDPWSLYSARASRTRCFCPPDSELPMSPIRLL